MAFFGGHAERDGEALADELDDELVELVGEDEEDEVMTGPDELDELEDVVNVVKVLGADVVSEELELIEGADDDDVVLLVTVESELAIDDAAAGL